ncbi:lasso peptide biosynthesis B2 protein [Leifsonia sp. TF02-11]|uniref:lasso peptide biosynthesis B2 protein n=1 Tax=Leifsonia sp. TF02-11 TaxID=2815212 RepID=UPI001AA18B89|nr:lasso peptide biosynthesis B2 protein [Leifsonia sp. TF02-11]MBO1739302.1 lasso peptide biosynthesis B2 protein [Leifsonia sp. TF02-11]
MSDALIGMSATAPVPARSRILASLIVPFAFGLARLRPAHLEGLLARLARRSHPASRELVEHSLDAVVTVSSRCAGRYCLQRSLAVALVCRLHGAWPDWCAGAATNPFRAHAWVEVDGVPVREPSGLAAGFVTTMRVPAGLARAV